MTSIRVALNGRHFDVGCALGEEARLEALAAHVVARFEALQTEHGAIGDERLLLMTALLLADALFDSETERAGAEARATAAEQMRAALQAAAAPRPARAKSAAPLVTDPSSPVAQRNANSS